MQVWCQPLQTLAWDKTLAISTKFKLNKEYNNGVTITLPKVIYVLVFIAYRFLQSVSRPSLYKLNATFRSSTSSHRHESCLTTCYIYSQYLVNKWSYFSKTNFLMTNRYRSTAVKGLQTLTISLLHVANDMYQCLYHVFIFHLRTFSRQHSEVLGIPDVMWEAGDLKSTEQTDGWNCGVFVCMVSYYYCKVYRHTHFHNMCLCH